MLIFPDQLPTASWHSLRDSESSTFRNGWKARAFAFGYFLCVRMSVKFVPSSIVISWHPRVSVFVTCILIGCSDHWQVDSEFVMYPFGMHCPMYHMWHFSYKFLLIFLPAFKAYITVLKWSVWPVYQSIVSNCHSILPTFSRLLYKLENASKVLEFGNSFSARVRH